MANTTQSQPVNHDHIIKWGAATAFALVLLGAGYAIYQTGVVTKSDLGATNSTTTAKNSPAPVVITSLADLTAADQTLDSSNIDSTNSDLSKNDIDLASF
jgi:hypothetical protein